jgi:hypothetical protein
MMVLTVNDHVFHPYIERRSVSKEHKIYVSVNKELEKTMWVNYLTRNQVNYHAIHFFFLQMARQPLGGLGRLIIRGFTITHSVGLLWTSDQLVAETST